MWFAEMGYRVGNGLKRSLAFETEKKIQIHNRSHFRQGKSQTLGILSFETAKTMSRLVSLHRSLSKEEFQKFRKEIIRSEGVTNLISKDEEYLITLAWTEKIEDMDHVASAVARLGKKCSDPGLTAFELFYTDLKLGFIDLGYYFDSKETERTLDKMDKFISTTADLYSGLESLTEMEISERKLKQWKCSGPILTQKPNYDLFYQKISWQKHRIRHLRSVSLWGQTFNKTVSLMIRTVCIIYARLCVVFSPYISVLPRVSPQHMRFPTQMQLQCYPDNCAINLSGPPPNEPPVKEMKNSSYSGPISNSHKYQEPLHGKTLNISTGLGVKENHHLILGRSDKATRLFQHATPSTVGGSGLGLRYANVIIVVERFLNSPDSIDDDGREDLYQMFPVSLRRLVDSKLKELMRKDEFGSRVDDSVVESRQIWDETKKILGWLAPMAHDMVRWQMERNVEKQSFDAKPRVLLLQTLFFADRKKMEAAIANILVGLNYIYRYEIGRPRGK